MFIRLTAILILACAVASGQRGQPLTYQELIMPRVQSYTVATLPTPTLGNPLAIVTDAATAGDCDTGSGSAIALCRWSGSAWVPIGDGGTTGGSVYWTVVGVGAYASKPATCTANQDVWICNGTGCPSNGDPLYCIATDTWSTQCPIPSQTGYVGAILATDGSTATWQTAGTVSYNKGTTAGTSTAYTLDLPGTLVAYSDGMEIKVIFHTASGAAPVTMAVDGLTAKTVYKSNGTSAPAQVTTNELQPLNVYVVRYNSALNSGTGGLVLDIGGASGTGAPAPGFGGYASIGTCDSSIPGKLYYATEISNKHWICDGSSTWKPIGFGMLLTEPPAATNWTAVNSPTISDVAGAVNMTFAGSGTSNKLVGMVKAVPAATPYSVEFAMTFHELDDGQAANTCGFYVANGDTAAASVKEFVFWNPTSFGNWTSYRYSTYAAVSTTHKSTSGASRVPVIRGLYYDDGTNRTVSYSIGGPWIQFYQEGRTVGITATHWGVGCRTGSTGNVEMDLLLYQWKVQ